MNGSDSSSQRLGVIGAGRSGAVTAACLAELGHTVFAVDVDREHVACLSGGRAPFFEPHLDALIERNQRADRLRFTTSFAEAIPDARFVLLCVGTPAQRNGDSDLSALSAAVEEMTPLLRDDAVVVSRSTVPVGTNALLAERLRTSRATIDVASNPEFLREGKAVDDFMKPDRIVIGATSERSAQAVATLYEALDCPILLTDLETAEMTKYAANAYLAASVTFINEIANICQRTGADVGRVAEALALDRRIGPQAYLAPGIGFGGSCLPKDLRALVSTAEQHAYAPDLLRAIISTNEAQHERAVIDRLHERFGELATLTIAVLGISFKGDTFDLRSSPAVRLIARLSEERATVRAFDPYAGERVGELPAATELCADAYRAAEGCDALIIATEHSSFRELDLRRLAGAMASPVLIDGRNLLDPEDANRAGFSYVGVGRGRWSD